MIQYFSTLSFSILFFFSIFSFPSKLFELVPAPSEKLFAEQLCSLENGYYCTWLGLRHEGRDRLTRAASYYQKGCLLGDARGCGSYGVLLFYGHGIRSRPAAAIKVLRQGCRDRYGQACANLGIIFSLGRYGLKDVVKGAAFFERGCELKSPLSCTGINVLCKKQLVKTSKYCKNK